jgi:hypothetical protein
VFVLKFPFRLLATHELTPSDEVAHVDDGISLKVTGAHPYYVLECSGFASEEQAGEWLKELRIGVGYLAVDHHLALDASFDLGQVQMFDEPRGFSLIPSSSLADASADGSRPFVHQEGLRVRTVVAHGSIEIRQGANFVLQALSEWRALSAPSLALNERRLLTALDLYVASLAEDSPNARFLLLISAMECICTPVPRTERASLLMEKWSSELIEALANEVDPSEKESMLAMQRELSFRRCNSISRQLRSLVSDALAGEDDAGWCADRLAELYDQRSQLLHTGRFKSEDHQRLSDSQSIARRILRSRAGFR